MQDYVGYRTRKRRSKEEKKKKLWLWLIAVAIIITIFVILGAAVKVYPFETAWNKTYAGMEWLGRQIKSLWPFKGKEKIPASKFLPEGKTAGSYLLAVTKQINDAPVLTTIILISYDAESGSGGMVYLPNDLLVNVPGLGMDQLSNLVELDEGRITKTLVTVENLLGIEVDRYVLGTDRDVRMILNQLSETYPVEVPSKISQNDPSLDVSLDLQPGKQNLSSSTLASYLTYAPPGKEIDLCKRQISFTPVFLEKSGQKFKEIEQLTAKNANLFDTDASDQELAGLWQAFTSLGGDKLLQGIIPVKEFKFEDTLVHRVDQDKLPAFVKKYVKSQSSIKESRRYRVEILNGNGVPGIGESVASRLDMQRFRVVNSANADNFEYPETVVIVYEDTPQNMRVANQVKNALEVGRVEVRPRTQDIAEITIIVGKDYAQK